MNNHKLKKNVTHHDTRTSIVHEEAKFFKNLDRKKKLLPKKKEELIDLQIERASKIQRNNLLSEQIDALEKEIRSIENNQEEIDYHLKMSKFITECDLKNNQETKNNGGAFFKKTASYNAGEKFDTYMAVCFGHIPKDSEKNYHKKILLCNYCSNTPLIVEPQTASAICPECGVSIHYQDETTNPEFREGVQIISPYAYKRINHFKEWLAQLQAKESTEIPEDVFNSILLELKKRRISDPKKVTTSLIRNILKFLRHNKYYEHIPTIIQRITGKQAPSLSQELENHLVNMFREIQEPFAKHKQIVAPDRKNFLSYSYTLNKMCELLGETDLLQYFPLLKSRDKNYVQDKIWKGICSDLGWQFNRSV
tara:strand:+ start:3821 stop:4918 length:1098 start_codon:yes stop_codon:yes gene_type:complete